jgi:hypothetical protein
VPYGDSQEITFFRFRTLNLIAGSSAPYQLVTEEACFTCRAVSFDTLLDFSVEHHFDVFAARDSYV